MKHVDRVEPEERRVELREKGRMVRSGRAAGSGETAEHPGNVRESGNANMKKLLLQKSVTDRQTDR